MGELSTRNETLSFDLELLSEQLSTERQNIQILLAENSRLRETLARKGVTTEEKRLPQDYESLIEWAETELAARITLLPRAIRSLKDAQYEDVSRVASALSVLAIEGVQWLCGQPNGRHSFASKCDELNLEFSKSISPTGAGQEGDAYFVEFPRGSGAKRFLEWHLKNRGNTRDPKKCLRIYFFYDQGSSQIVVGSLPGHLPIESSN